MNNKIQNKNSTVVVGMSGGVDSSVAALLLKQQGHKVIGLFMKNWDETLENGECSTKKDYEDVEEVCRALDIPYYSIDFVEEYRNKVFLEFVREYELGHTPNPDILCNREIKFNVFFKKAMELGADFLATGHYAQVIHENGRYTMQRGVDENKDQTYFLYTLKEEILKKVLFPIGHLPKSEVRKLALQNGLITHNKKDSTGICFIGERHFKSFLSRYITFKEGPFKEWGKDEVIIGYHTGASYYTRGQRKGLGLGGSGEPWFVAEKDMKTNTVYVVRGENHPALNHNGLIAHEISLIKEQGTIEELIGLKLTGKIRYRQKDVELEIISYSKETDEMVVHFKDFQKAITVRQSLVLYHQETCLGGAMIKSYFNYSPNI